MILPLLILLAAHPKGGEVLMQKPPKIVVPVVHRAFALPKFVPSGTGQFGYAITVGWNPVAGASSYNLYYGGLYSGQYTNLVTTTTTQATITGLSPGTYYVAATALDGAPESGLSDELETVVDQVQQVITQQAGDTPNGPWMDRFSWTNTDNTKPSQFWRLKIQ